MDKLDCVVVGAGWAGLAAAKQYRFLNPESPLLILESQGSLGGVWADERLYPGLKSNNLLGTYEFPDFPMRPDVFGVQPGNHIPGEVVNAYMKAYAAKFDIDHLVRAKTKLLAAEHQDTQDGGWVLTIEDGDRGKTKIFARRLVMATGLTSEAFLPHFDGQETFGGAIFHGKHFQQNRDTIQPDKLVTIMGGSKLAWDAVYTYASAGAKVNWVIRSSGHGPAWMAPPYVTPLKRWIEGLANTRLLTWFSPCIWGHVDGYAGIRRFLHGTAIGRAIVNGFWAVLGNDTLKLCGYDSHPEMAKLKPWTHPMFTGASFSILNYDTDIFEFVRSNQVKVHIGEVNHLSPGMVHLADGTAIASDVLLAHTGWKQVPAIKFLPEGIESELGIPHLRTSEAREQDIANQSSLIEKADREILQLFPRLRDQPVWNKKYVPLLEQEGISTTTDDTDPPETSLTPYMLHRFIVPPSERFLRTRDVAFIGLVNNFSNIIAAHMEGLWIAAYFSGRLAVDPASAVGDQDALRKLRYETVLHNRFGHWRYPTDWDNRGPSFIFDAVPYLDLLQTDLGLETHRKSAAWREMLEPYDPRDYQGVNEEWMKKWEDS